MSKFLESFERFRNGTATEEETLLVREEIEKHEAIDEYIADEFEHSFSPAPEGTHDAAAGKRISWKARIRVVGTVLAVLLIIAVVAYSAIAICNSYYYDPNEGIAAIYGSDGQLFIDLWAFSELHSPEYTTMGAEAWRDGPGSYQLRIYQSNMFTGGQVNASERIVRGEVMSNESRTQNEYWHFPIGNAFGYREGSIAWVDENGNHNRYPETESLQRQIDALEELPSSTQAAVYVTFEHDLTLREFSDLYERWSGNIDFLYAAVVSSDGYIPNTVGFSPSGGGIVLENAPEEYPYFQLFNHHDEMQTDRAVVWEKHFRSVVSYLSSRPQFLDAMTAVNGIGTNYYRELLEYIDQNGTEIYGALVTGSTGEILSFLESENTFDFYVSDIKLSVLSRG